MENFLHNYKIKPFTPAIQKTTTLVILSAMSIICLIVSINTTKTFVSESFEDKVKAAELMKDGMKKIEKHQDGIRYFY